LKIFRKKFVKKSLNTIYLKSFIVFSAFVLLIIIILSGVFLYKITKTWNASLSNLTEYIDELKNDDFANIPSRKFSNCSFMILDENYEVIYKNNDLVDESINKKELNFISEYESNLYFTVSNYTEDGEERYLVAETSMNEDLVQTVKRYSILDKDYNVLSGTLFQNQKSLTQKEFNFLLGNYLGKYYITKYTYNTYDGWPRFIVFFSPVYDSSQYDKKIIDAFAIWWLFIPLYIILLVVAVVLISNQTKRFSKTLNSAILGFSHGKRINVTEYKGPCEFVEIANNFDMLVGQLTESKEQQKRSDGEKQRILTDLSHDLKTPITVIQGYSKAICDGLIEEKDKDKYIETIYKKATALTELTESFFEYSIMEHPSFVIEPEVCDLCEFCQEYLAEKYQEIEHEGFILSLNLPEQPIYCILDKKKFRRVLENLINNSLKYNKAGTTVFFSITQENEKIYIVIGDNGIGIPEAIIDTIFDPFVIGDPARGTNKGTGLGMAIVKKIVVAHYGTIKLVVPPKEGYSTQFEIILIMTSDDNKK